MWIFILLGVIQWHGFLGMHGISKGTCISFVRCLELPSGRSPGVAFSLLAYWWKANFVIVTPHSVTLQCELPWISFMCFRINVRSLWLVWVGLTVRFVWFFFSFLKIIFFKLISVLSLLLYVCVKCFLTMYHFVTFFLLTTKSSVFYVHVYGICMCTWVWTGAHGCVCSEARRRFRCSSLWSCCFFPCRVSHWTCITVSHQQP